MSRDALAGASSADGGDDQVDPAPERGPGPRGFKDMFATMRAAFPDLQLTPEHMTATEDDVAPNLKETGGTR